MATINAIGELPVNLFTFDVERFNGFEIATANATTVELALVDETTVTFSGNFVILGNIPVNGTVTGYTDNTLSLTGISVPAAQILEAIDNEESAETFLPGLLSGNDDITGGVGNDSLAGYDGADLIIGGEGNDFLRGGLRADTIRGGLGRDGINGGNGFDVLNGGQGGDSITGGLGNDVLTGGLGLDTLVGSEGADSFVIIAPNSGLDIINDFNLPNTGILGDTLQVVGSAFGAGLTAGVLAANRFAIGSTATTADVRFLYNNGALFFDADGNGSGVAVQIATLVNATPIQASNIVVI